MICSCVGEVLDFFTPKSLVGLGFLHLLLVARIRIQGSRSSLPLSLLPSGICWEI
ncbi:uncharacterized protein J3R85_011132 [Psidium guajava]|nr:uncharacterized protein J3R85_011132 [Psidium guajava]